MPDAEDIRLQSLYENAVRSGNQASAQAYFDQMQVRAEQQAAQRRQQRIANPVGVPPRLTVDEFNQAWQDFADAEDIASSTGRQPASADPFQNFLNTSVQTFNPTQRAQIEQLAQTNPELARKIFETSTKVGGAIKRGQEIGRYLTTKAQQLPEAIAAPFRLTNPIVEPGGIIPPGTKLNAQAANWLAEQTGNPLNQYSLDAMGGKVKFVKNPFSTDLPEYDIAFEGASGFTRPKQVRKDLARIQNEINKIQTNLKSLNPETDRTQYLYNQDELEAFTRRRQGLVETLNEFKQNPLVSEAVRYQLGRGIEAIPENSLLTAAPIGGAGGERARLYRALSGGALETIPRMVPDLSRYPTEEEFRAASSGGGMSPADFRERNAMANTIATGKKGPTEFVTWKGESINWDPSTLKDPMIRAAFNIPSETDVSALRANPMNAFVNTGAINFNKPVITTRSPQYVSRQVAKTTGRAAVPGITAIGADAVINFALGESPQQAIVGAVSNPISAENLGGAPTANITRLGPQGQFVDMRTNTVIGPRGQYTNQGVAFKGGKPVLVPRGSVAGEGNIFTQTRDVLKNAGNVWRGRLRRLGIPGF